MKKGLLVLFIAITSVVSGQIPTGYYSTATGNGYTLKTQLKDIITTGHVDQGYGALYDAYMASDNDAFYEMDGTVLDMYSEDPTGTDPYNYTHNNNNCGNYNSENDCYNREHIFPQGFFNSQFPMKSDIHHVVPSDGYVNGRRASYPFGEVSNPTWTSANGSKVGPNTYSTYNGVVFEPLDEFKGDIARMLLYFAVRYEDHVTDSSWDAHSVANNPLNGTNDQVYETWYLQLLNKWHEEDPVSNRELVRNNAAHAFQGNRNPFIDHPEFVLEIWDTVLAVSTIQIREEVTVYPNPTHNHQIQIAVPNGTTLQQVTLYSVLGKVVFTTTNPITVQNKLQVKELKTGIYLLQITTNNTTITKKVVVQ